MVPILKYFCVFFFFFLFRQGWGSEFDLEDPRFLAIAVAEHQLLQAEYEDYTVANSGGIACCRSVAVVVCFMNISVKFVQLSSVSYAVSLWKFFLFLFDAAADDAFVLAPYFDDCDRPWSASRCIYFFQCKFVRVTLLSARKWSPKVFIMSLIQ